MALTVFHLILAGAAVGILMFASTNADEDSNTLKFSLHNAAKASELAKPSTTDLTDFYLSDGEAASEEKPIISA